MEIGGINKQFRVWNTKKVIIISNPKIASSFLDRTIYENESEKIENIFTFQDDLTLSYNKNFNETDKIDFEKIFSNQNKKDILVLYRNPFEKYLSGVVQDFTTTLLFASFQVDFLIDGIFQNEKFDASEFLKIPLSKKRDYIESIGKNEKYLYYFKFLLQKYFYYTMENNIETVHTQKNLLGLYTFINHMIVDKNKMYLLDIDSINESFLKNYIETKYELFPKQIQIKNSQKPLKEVLLQVIKEHNLQNKLENYLKDEMFFYNLIKSLNQNIK